jgi:hypothetical protein
MCSCWSGSTAPRTWRATTSYRSSRRCSPNRRWCAAGPDRRRRTDPDRPSCFPAARADGAQHMARTQAGAVVTNSAPDRRLRRGLGRGRRGGARRTGCHSPDEAEAWTSQLSRRPRHWHPRCGRCGGRRLDGGSASTYSLTDPRNRRGQSIGVQRHRPNLPLVLRRRDEPRSLRVPDRKRALDRLAKRQAGCERPDECVPRAMRACALLRVESNTFLTN